MEKLYCMASISKEDCKKLYSMLDKETGVVIRRMVSTPFMSEREIKGTSDFWKYMTSQMEKECNCKNLSKVGRDVETALKSYEQGTKMKGKRGGTKRARAVIKIGSASVDLDDKAIICKLR